jgi:hypothetical protein
MKDITHHQKRCAEIMGWNPENKFLPFYKSDWREQIPVWQKIVSVVCKYEIVLAVFKK